MCKFAFVMLALLFTGGAVADQMLSNDEMEQVAAGAVYFGQAIPAKTVCDYGSTGSASATAYGRLALLCASVSDGSSTAVSWVVSW